ncbi:hypothetical protein MFIFM68171_00532 [Madurella fahalii]|uniref:Cell wall proline rich protein n=1 Tax=Madurella fahalii TaxID=1157608 RepID=A0ABQ0FXU4_9PEZI
MAATIGPDMVVDAPSPDCLEHGAALHLAGSPAMTDQHLRPTNPQASPRSNPPPPNPPFVFPARPTSSSATSSFPRATGRRPRSVVEPYEPVSKTTFEDEKPASRSPALPAFSFNPGASLPATPGPESMFLSPPQSPSAPGSPRSGPVRHNGHGHRRGGSEFVGGSIRDGEAITVMNVSPTKSESGMASPLLQPTTKPRRGHAHRRSAAISSHDLSSIILPPSTPNARGSSAPTSPAVAEKPAGQGFPGTENLDEQEKPVPPSASESHGEEAKKTPLPVVQIEQAPKPAVRNKVGFSDTLEYIPRPLSLVSTDTSSTVTARLGHSVSGSISSVISLSNGDRELNPPLCSTPTARHHDSRPSTAGAVMERTQSAQEQDPALRSPRRRGSIPLLGALPPPLPLSPATPSPTRSSKKWSLFGREPFITGSPTRLQPDSPRSTASHCSTTGRVSIDGTPDTHLNGFEEASSAPKLAGKKRGKKPKKVKTWAGSILSRKGKYRYGKQKRRTPTPPPLRHPERLGGIDDDITHMSLDPEPLVPTFTLTQSPGAESWENWTFPKPASVPEEDASYPMIDLDAALGPFNTPLPRNPEWEAAQRAGGHIKKQLHSAAGMSRFSGPGMHYHHRRAESAPELVPFEGGRFGFRRFGSSSTMADVFEEDEEDEENSTGNSANSSTNNSGGQSTPVVETPVAEPLQAPRQSEEEHPSPKAAQTGMEGDNAVQLLDEDGQLGSGGAETLSQTARVPLDRPTTSGCDEAVLGESVPRHSTASRGSSPGEVNSGSTTPSPHHAFRPKDLAPVEVSPLNLPSASLAPISPYSMTQSSAFPSPRTPMSYDAHCISTAPSSVTEDNFQSLLMGEPGPEVRISVDDIPSLTSSNSTMTRDSLFGQYPQARHPPLGDQPRPASFTSTAFGRRRSSLASLSRLINSSHGERSKLSIEVPMDSEPEKKSKTSKAKRLSRMVQFWKSKESSAT